MRPLALLLIVAACAAPEQRTVPPEPVKNGPISELTFKDHQLQLIATRLIEKARSQGIDQAAGETPAERLISLEAMLGEPPLAQERVNKMAAEVMRFDLSPWAKMRAQAQRDFCPPSDDIGRRVCEMADRWNRYKLDSALRYLSSNYSNLYIDDPEWERRFHEFVAARPLDAATWGWLVLRAHRTIVEKQYGRADSEMGYRYYLESSGLGTGREAAQIFSVPGIAISGDS